MSEDRHNPIPEAVRLVRRRKAQVRKERKSLAARARELAAEDKRLDTALAALGVEVIDPAGQLEEGEETEFLSVREYVERTVRANGRPWTTGQLLQALEKDITVGVVDVRASNLERTVSSAVHTLVGNGVLVRLADGTLIPAHQMRQSLPVGLGGSDAMTMMLGVAPRSTSA
jgi:hypothetical protein